MTTPLLQVDDLTVRYRTGDEEVAALDGVGFTVDPGERLAIIGESGSGKSTLTHVLLGVLAPNAHVHAARVELAGTDLVGDLSEKQWNELRRTRLAYVPQDPNIALNPVHTVGKQLTEAIRLSGAARGPGQRVEKLRLREEAIDLLERVGIPEAGRVFASYPHQISGGQRQRVLIAIALIGRPEIIIADEPTSGLDVTVQKTVLDALDALVAETGVALIIVTHDLAVARQRSDRVLVLEGGRIVEQGDTIAVTDDPQHAYTRRLLDAVPSLHHGKLAPTPGISPWETPRGDSGLVATGLVRTYVTRDARRGKIVNEAVKTVSFTIDPGTTYGLVGESGSGKSTIARIVAGIDTADGGTVLFQGADIARAKGAARRELYTRIQYVFQNPYTSLNPRFSVFDVIAEPLRGFRVAAGADLERRVQEAVDAVGLERSFLTRRPAQLSGGQRQRVAIARSIVLRPELIVLDEPVSALDVSVQAQITQLLVDLQTEFGVSYLFISHDLAVIRELSDRVGVLRRGELVEEGTVESVFSAPQHEYTRRLIDAIPVIQ